MRNIQFMCTETIAERLLLKAKIFIQTKVEIDRCFKGLFI